jgi:RluA family pseudouridine synthase
VLNNIPAAYEDEFLLVVNKPPGLLTISGPGSKDRHLTLILNEDAVREGKSYKLHACHRLDKETSGLVMYAKNNEVCQLMMDKFRRHEVRKFYRAFAHGRISQDEGRITKPLEGKPAVTVFRVLKRSADYTDLDVRPQTGRTNQIRLHFKSIGHPLVGESKFIFRRDFALRAKRLCLHAVALEFTHPVTKKNIRVQCPLANDMEKFLLEHA